MRQEAIHTSAPRAHVNLNKGLTSCSYQLSDILAMNQSLWLTEAKEDDSEIMHKIILYTVEMRAILGQYTHNTITLYNINPLKTQYIP